MGARTRGFANNVLTSGKIDATDGLTGNLAAANFADATVTNVEELPPAVGSAISSVAGNPAAPVATGKIWYNTSTDSFNVAANLAAWVSGGNLVNNSQGRAGFGTQTAAVAGPGVGPGGGIQVTEEYNGIGWSNGNNSTRPADANRYNAGAGTPTAGAIASGGYPGTMTAETEEYDGTSWTAGNSVNTARRGYVFDGAVITSSLITGGNTQPYPGTTTLTAATEHYDGTSWTSGGSMNTGRTNHGGSSTGSQTSSLMFGGNYPPGPPFGQTTNTEEYNGTSWTEVNNTPITRSYWGYAGSQTSTIAFQGYTTGSPAQTSSITYDGTNWSSGANSTLARLNYHNNSGTSTAALVFGGEASTGTVTTTEEYNDSVLVYTPGAWASGGALNNARRQATGTGLQTAALSAGGYSGTATMNNTEEYDNLIWLM